MSSVNLYQIPQVINTSQAGSVGVNSATNKIDFDVSKNVHTEVEFLLKDVDRKAVSLNGKTLIIYVINQTDRTLKLQKSLQVINAARGHCRLTIAPSDIADWDTGYFAYSIVIMREDQTQVLVHQDQNRSQYGFFELKQGPLPSPQSAIVLGDNEFRLDMGYDGYTNYWGYEDLGNQTLVPKWITGAYKGSAQRDNRVGKHTMAIYTKNFTGTFRVQGSLENGIPNSDQEWFNVGDVSLLNNKTGITNVEFTGSFMWVRFIYVPYPQTTGAITKVLFKN